MKRILSPDRFMTLACLKDSSSFNIDNYIANTWDLAASYFLAVRMPIAELFGNTLAERANEILSFTTTAEWRSGGRRSVQCGDIYCEGVTPWLYVGACRLTVFPGFHTLSDWPAYGIVKLPDAKIKAAFGSEVQHE